MKTTEYKQHDRLLVAVDCIILGFNGKDLKALLIKRNMSPEQGKWSLMGGFVKEKESVDEAAKRVLAQLTGLSDVFMEQLFCFGDVQRDPGGRVISIAFYALIKIDDSNAEALTQHNAKWVPLNRPPSLIFDHRNMVKMARQRLKEKAVSHPIGFALLPKKFTLQQLQSLYEAIYQKQFDKRNFLRKIQSLGILTRLDEKEKESSRKGAFYYVFNKEKYNKLDKETIEFL